MGSNPTGPAICLTPPVDQNIFKALWCARKQEKAPSETGKKQVPTGKYDLTQVSDDRYTKVQTTFDTGKSQVQTGQPCFTLKKESSPTVKIEDMAIQVNLSEKVKRGEVPLRSARRGVPPR